VGVRITRSKARLFRNHESRAVAAGNSKVSLFGKAVDVAFDGRTWRVLCAGQQILTYKVPGKAPPPKNHHWGFIVSPGVQVFAVSLTKELPFETSMPPHHEEALTVAAVPPRERRSSPAKKPETKEEPPTPPRQEDSKPAPTLTQKEDKEPPPDIAQREDKKPPPTEPEAKYMTVGTIRLKARSRGDCYRSKLRPGQHVRIRAVGKWNHAPGQPAVGPEGGKGKYENHPLMALMMQPAGEISERFMIGKEWKGEWK
jgi:hypothetical protein